MVEDIPHDGDRLKELMQLHGTTDVALAEATEASAQAVGKWKKTGKFARDKVALICRAIGCTSDELLGLTPIKNPKAIYLINDARADYAIHRDYLHKAVAYTLEGLSSSVLNRPPEATADLVLAVHDALQESDGEISKPVVLTMIRSAA